MSSGSIRTLQLPELDHAIQEVSGLRFVNISDKDCLPLLEGKVIDHEGEGERRFLPARSLSGASNMDQKLDDVTRTFAEHGDLAHLALFLWASGASGLLVWALRELAASNRRFNDFVNEIARLNRFFSDRD